MKENNLVIVDFLKSKGFIFDIPPYKIKRTYAGEIQKMERGAFSWVLIDKEGFVKCGSEQTLKNILYAIKKGVCEVSFSRLEANLISPFYQCSKCSKIVKSKEESNLHVYLHAWEKKKATFVWGLDERDRHRCEEYIKEIKDKLKKLKKEK